MKYYFGFEPSDELHQKIEEGRGLIKSGKDEPYYPIRNDISHKIGQEIIHNLLYSLIDAIPDPARQARMTKIVGKIEGATNTMLNVLLGKDKNEEVMPNFDYLENETVFTDNNGKMRIGFEMTEEQYNDILKGFDTVSDGSSDMPALMSSLKVMNHGVIDHFITRFSETLPLGMIKRKAVPMGKGAIQKALDMAMNKLLPELGNESLHRVVNFYRPYMVKINES